LRSAQVLVDGRLAALTDSSGAYQVRGVYSGLHQVAVRLIGFATSTRDTVPVHAGETTRLDFAPAIPGGAARGRDGRGRAGRGSGPAGDGHRAAHHGDDLRHLPVSTLEEAVALSAGTVGESYRGGRLGEQAFIIDGLGLKNQLDASTGALGSTSRPTSSPRPPS